MVPQISLCVFYFVFIIGSCYCRQTNNLPLVHRALASDWIQESDHMFVDSPYPIVFPKCCSSRSRPSRMPLQPWEMAEEAVTFRHEVLWQYFPKIILDKRQVGAVRSVLAILARKALLKACMSRNPKPHSLFGIVSLFQESQQIFLCPALASHQNLRRTD
ncbi:hypothetical protein Bca52824_046257 [Brassica carinata]|uniref:Secreted protein n=1 Tax=Brassica carinata TaxID=52824 RepID=A0A8X7RGT2_BRACI|nr:hypothetical protein Bca52824_046257 [Brassica carinata]